MHEFPSTSIPSSGDGRARSTLSDGSRRRSNIDVMIPAFNEEKNIAHAIQSVVDWADNVFILDSESKDRTREIAEGLGAKVVIRPWLGYARQKNWGLDNLPFTSDWIFILDSDENILPELRDELIAIAARPVNDVAESGYWINRYFIFLGRRIRHCGFYPSWNVRFFKRGKARYEEREVHEHMIVDGPVGYLKGHMEHNDRRGLEVYMDKHNKYSTLEAWETIRAEQLGLGRDDAKSTDNVKASLFGGAIARRRWMKYKVYPRLPCKWLARFVYMYVLKLGFLDGLTGLRFCLFMTAYELLIQLKIIELRLETQETKPEN